VALCITALPVLVIWKGKYYPFIWYGTGLLVVEQSVEGYYFFKY